MDVKQVRNCGFSKRYELSKSGIQVRSVNRIFAPGAYRSELDCQRRYTAEMGVQCGEGRLMP